MNFKINPHASAFVISAGEEQTPIVIIDNVADDTGDVVRHAVESASFAPAGSSGYPGVRAPLPDAYVHEMVTSIAPMLARIYSVPRNLNLGLRSYYSLVATPPEELVVTQRIPHVDSHRKYHFAVTHYLNSGDFGGTGVFRHKPTGFEKITEDRVAEYDSAMAAFFRAHGEPPLEYIRESTDHFEFILGIDYRPNRLIAYPGSLLHSGLIDPENDISADPATGRLTSNFFFESQ